MIFDNNEYSYDNNSEHNNDSITDSGSLDELLGLGEEQASDNHYDGDDAIENYLGLPSDEHGDDASAYEGVLQEDSPHGDSPAVSAHDAPVESETPQEGDGAEDKDEEGVSVDTSAIKDKVFTVPANATTSEEFSKRDLYHIINTVIALRALDESLIDTVKSAFGIRGNVPNDLNLALRLHDLDDNEVQGVVHTLTIINDILDTISAPAGNQLTSILRIAGQVEALEPDEKNNLIQLMRRMVSDVDANIKIAGNKNTSGLDITQTVTNALSTSKDLRDYVSTVHEVVSLTCDILGK